MYTGSCVPYIMPMLSKNCSSQHNSCMHTMSGHTSRAEQSVLSRLAVLFRNAMPLPRLVGHSLTWSGCVLWMRRRVLILEHYIGLIRSAVNLSTILQKSSGWVCNKSFSQTTSSLSWWMAPLTHLLVMEKLSI